MGMAASQARLLTITARLHDVEYKAQSIQNAKIQLSTQSDQVYNEYLEALNATSLTITAPPISIVLSTVSRSLNHAPATEKETTTAIIAINKYMTILFLLFFKEKVLFCRIVSPIITIIRY